MRGLIVLVIVVLLPFGCSGRLAGTDFVDAYPIELDPSDPARTDVGRLRFVGGLELRSRDPRFGGFSSMALSPDGAGLTILSDRAVRFEATLAHNSDGTLAGARFRDGAALLPGLAASQRRTLDSEAMVRLPNGDIVVGFEHHHRVLRFPGGWKEQPAVVSAPDGIAGLPANGGLESLALLHDGRLVMIAEEGEGGLTSVWLGGPGAWDKASYVLEGYFRPTDAAVLPSGDLLVLERRFTWVGGIAARLVRIATADLRPGARIGGQEVARLERPLAVDNFEAIAVHPLRPGEVAVYLLSDDNFNVLQRTLLMEFILLDQP